MSRDDSTDDAPHFAPGGRVRYVASADARPLAVDVTTDPDGTVRITNAGATPFVLVGWIASADLVAEDNPNE